MPRVQSPSGPLNFASMYDANEALMESEWLPLRAILGADLGTDISLESIPDLSFNFQDPSVLHLDPLSRYYIDYCERPSFARISTKC